MQYNAELALQYRQRAEELRGISLRVPDVYFRETFWRIAQAYDGLADIHQHSAKETGRSVRP